MRKIDVFAAAIGLAGVALVEVAPVAAAGVRTHDELIFPGFGPSYQAALSDAHFNAAQEHYWKSCHVTYTSHSSSSWYVELTCSN